MYHGRKFNMDGKYQFMPEFNEAKFSGACDNLHKFPITNGEN